MLLLCLGGLVDDVDEDDVGEVDDGICFHRLTSNYWLMMTSS